MRRFSLHLVAAIVMISALGSGRQCAAATRINDGIRPHPIQPFRELNCTHPGADRWPTWAHDYARASASSIELGDPENIRLAWATSAYSGVSRSTDATASDQWVYYSTANTRNAFRLENGDLVSYEFHLDDFVHWTTDCRSSMTIAGDAVYQTTGVSGGLRKWDVELRNEDWTTDLPGHQLGWGPMPYGVTVVTTAGDDEIIVAGTTYGYLLALNTSDASLYEGWSSNPVLLQGGVLHSPAFDGDNLYVATGDQYTQRSGTINRVDLQTGAVIWSTTSAMLPEEGFPGGVSVDDDYVYAAGVDGYGGSRVKLRKSDGSIVWEHYQSPSHYAGPTVGRRYLYMSQEYPDLGVIVVDKVTGAEVYNWKDDGVRLVTSGVTLTCDGYLFVGGQYGEWWCLDANNFTVAHVEQFDGIVNGTALTTGPNGEVYALVGLRSHFDGTGGIAAFRLDDPDLDDLTITTTSPVEIDNTLNALFGGGSLDGCIDPNRVGELSVLDLVKLIENRASGANQSPSNESK